jgi:hypothetical protein
MAGKESVNKKNMTAGKYLVLTKPPKTLVSNPMNPQTTSASRVARAARIA